MDQLIYILVTAIASAAIAIPVTRASDMSRFRTERRLRAADELANHAHRLESLVVQAHPGLVDGSEFCEAMIRWDETWNQHYAALPRGWSHLGRSVRGAVGEFAGLPAAASYDRRAWTAPLADHDGDWQVNAEFYLRYVTCRLRRLGQSRRHASLLDFDSWLRDHDVRRDLERSD